MLTTEHTWDAFYDQHGPRGQCREWYLTARAAYQHIRSALAGSEVVGECLHSGCGNSSLSILLQQAYGHEGVVNTDFSSPVISAMRTRYPSLCFQREDVRSMSFARGRFGLIVDKGTLDATSSDSGESAKNVAQVLAEYRRVLRSDVDGRAGTGRAGTCLVFSLFGSDYWRPFLEAAPGWSWDITLLDATPNFQEDAVGKETSGSATRGQGANKPEDMVMPSEVGGAFDREEAFLLRLVPVPLADDTRSEGGELVSNERDRRCKGDAGRGHVRFEDDGFSPRQQQPSPVVVAGAKKCLKCKTMDVTYECDPCGCPSFCRTCAMKVASGGKCRQCKSMYGGVRKLRK